MERSMIRLPIRTCFLFAILLVILPSAISTSKDDARYDLVIRNGKIVDGTGNPWFYGDLAVKGDKIAALGNVAAKGKREIDAKGLIVAPGFIDMHSHSDYTILEDGNAQSKIRQGVTTEVLGESTSAGPYQGKLKPIGAKIKGKPTEWTTLAGYFDAVDKAGVSTNVASFVGLGTVCPPRTSSSR
jgi:N-acyl-D-amino-acid deacylase